MRSEVIPHRGKLWESGGSNIITAVPRKFASILFFITKNRREKAEVKVRFNTYDIYDDRFGVPVNIKQGPFPLKQEVLEKINKYVK